MTIFTDTLATEQALLARAVTPPGPPLAFGTDLSCVSDITDRLDSLDPNSPLGVAQSLIRRLTCPRGGLPDDRNYGTDVRGFLNRGASPTDLQGYESQVRGECAKDDRVDSTDVTLAMFTATKTLRIRIQVTPADPTTNDFEFVFTVDDTQALLESIR